MAIVRINLASVRYPEVAPNSVLVLQSLRKAGYKIIFRNVHYKNKDQIISYFEEKNLKIAFIGAKPDIDVNYDGVTMNSKKIISGNTDTLWKDLDIWCLENKVYKREGKDEFIPSYKHGFFLVLNYGLEDQTVDSKVISRRACHTKGTKLIQTNPAINTIDLVDASTLEIVEHYNKKEKCFKPSTETVYFSVLV